MTRDDIIRMALEAQAYRSSFDRWTMYDSDIERFAALVAAAEREACAKLCNELRQHAKADDKADSYPPTAYHAGRADGAKSCAAAIRARGAAPEGKP